MAVRHPLFSALYDTLVAPGEFFGMAKARARLVSGLRGTILELGFGTGLNLPFYRGDALVVGIEPDPGMLRRALSRRDTASATVCLAAADAQALPFKAASFDHAVATLVFCTVPDPVAALAELRRVLKPGGVLHFIEHVRAPGARLASFQDAIAPLWTRAFAGCNPNRTTLDIFRDAGFVVDNLQASNRGVVITGEASAG